MASRLAALANDTKGMVLERRSAADAAEKTLLHTAVEFKNGNLRRRNLHLDRDFSEGKPWDDDEDGHEDGEPELLPVEERVGIGPPFPSCNIIRITQDDKDPSRRQTKPANEAVMSLEDIVVGAVSPLEM